MYMYMYREAHAQYSRLQLNFAVCNDNTMYDVYNDDRISLVVCRSNSYDAITSAFARFWCWGIPSFRNDRANYHIICESTTTKEERKGSCRNAPAPLVRFGKTTHKHIILQIIS